MLFLSFLLTGALGFAPAAPAILLTTAPPLPTPRREFALATGACRIAAGSPDGRLLAVADAQTSVTLFQVRTGLPLRVYLGHQQPVIDLVFSAGRDTVVSVDASGEVCLWNAETAVTLDSWRVPAPTSASAPAPVVAVRITPDGRNALVVLATGAVWRWNLRQSKLGAERLPGSGILNQVLVTAVEANPSDTRLALGLATGAVVLLDLQTGLARAVNLFRQPVLAVATLADSVLAVAGTPEIASWRLEQPDGAAARIGHLPTERAIVTLAADPAGTRLALGCASGETEVMDLTTYQVERLALAPKGPQRVWFEPFDNLLVALGADGRVRSWKLPE